MPKVLSRIGEYMGSKKFYRLVLGIFIFEAVWIAVSAAYPQAFDENFHFGMIKVYSHYWLPFLTSQPPHADAYGAVTRDPSYLYHYLMSFPYRLIELLTRNQLTQVIILRFINVGLFAWGIVLFRKVLLRVGTNTALTNLILMLFVLIPIVPQLAAQINYDNLLIPLTAAMILLGFRIMDEIRAKKISSWSIGMLIGFGLLVSLVKYAFLPIFAGIVVFLAIVVIRNYRHNLAQFFKQLLNSWKTQTRPAKFVLALLIIVSLGMFIQRDGVNLVVYHNIQPNCANVLSVKQCLAYGPWAANYRRHNKLLNGASMAYSNPLIYGFQWLYWMWYRLFFAVNGPNKGFTNYPPLPLPSLAALIVLFAGTFALIKWWRKIFANNLYLVMLFVISMFYIVALMGQGYITYRYTDVLENMNGRYLLPILLLVCAIFGHAMNEAFQRRSRKIIFALIILLFFVDGGGLLTFIARSDSNWDVHNKTVIKINDTARTIVKHVVAKGKKTYDTNIWFFN